jgi:hypothetical protein
MNERPRRRLLSSLSIFSRRSRPPKDKPPAVTDAQLQMLFAVLSFIGGCAVAWLLIFGL